MRGPARIRQYNHPTIRHQSALEAPLFRFIDTLGPCAIVRQSDQIRLTITSVGSGGREVDGITSLHEGRVTSFWASASGGYGDLLEQHSNDPMGFAIGIGFGALLRGREWQLMENRFK